MSRITCNLFLSKLHLKFSKRDTNSKLNLYLIILLLEPVKITKRNLFCYKNVALQYYRNTFFLQLSPTHRSLNVSICFVGARICTSQKHCSSWSRGGGGGGAGVAPPPEFRKGVECLSTPPPLWFWEDFFKKIHNYVVIRVLQAISIGGGGGGWGGWLPLNWSNYIVDVYSST